MANFTVTVSDIDIKALENDILDVDEWIQNAVLGKINNCKKRMLTEWYPRLTADPEVESIPANDDSLITLIIARDDYKSRKQREVEIKDKYPK